MDKLHLLGTLFQSAPYLNLLTLTDFFPNSFQLGMINSEALGKLEGGKKRKGVSPFISQWPSYRERLAMSLMGLSTLPILSVHRFPYVPGNSPAPLFHG